MTDALTRLTDALSDRYRIERELGAGGMATVYLAADLKHERPVAIKVLRPELAAVIGAERFLREIKTIATLQHPHILGLIDSGELDGTAYYVMPYVEGESLRDRLLREKQLPIADAVRLATEVAGALDYAHRHGVIHRDIKPENILLHDGAALVADFGIALAVSAAGGTRMTETGMSLGTPHYMSPEQAMGEREITARSDVYALGAVTYEMLVGDPPFTGSTAQAIVAKVVTEKPVPPSRGRETVPSAVEDAVLTALEKLPADRFATAAEFAAALQGPTTGPMRRTRSNGGARRAAPRARFLWPIGLAVAIAAAVWGWMRPRVTVPAFPPSRLALLVPTLGGASAELQRQLAMTPDGRTLLYRAGGDGGMSRTMTRTLDAAEATEISGLPQGVAGYVVSPTGREFLGMDWDAQQLVRYQIDGGRGKPIPVSVGRISYAAWAGDGSLWLGAMQDLDRGIERLGPNDSITHPFGTKNADLAPTQILRGDRTALAVKKPFGVASGPAFLLDLATGEATPLIDAGIVDIRYAAGYLIYALTNGNLDAVPFDLAGARIVGSAVTIATGVSLTGTGFAQFTVADNGTVAYIPEEPRSLVLVDRSGASQIAVGEGHNYHSPRFSSDGRRVAVDFTTSDGRDVWVLRLADETLSRATFLKDGHDPTWAPDGAFLTFISTRSGALGIYRVRPGRVEPPESLFASAHLGYTGIWLGDGSALVTTGVGLAPESRTDIGIVRNGGRGPLEPLVATRFDEQYPAVSHDNQWLAFCSVQSGRVEVYARRLDGSGEQVQISHAGGTEPVWGPTGHELFYRASTPGGAVLMVATLARTPTLSVTDRRPLFSVSEIASGQPHSNYDVSPDGTRFVMVRLNPASRIMVIQNLAGLVAELRGNAGTGD